MKRLAPPAILLLVMFACGKKEEPAPETPPAPATQTAPQVEQSPPVPPQAVAEPSTPTAETTTPNAEKAKPTNANYIVAKGDTLYSIAKKNGLNYRDLAKWNKIKDPRRLRVGQELRLAAPGR